MALQENGIYILLFLRSDQPVNDDFHWALYHHYNDTLGGKKYHITGSVGTWTAGHVSTIGVVKSFLLVGLFHICTVLAGFEAHVDTQIRQYDEALNPDPTITCRVWLFRVLAKLKEPVSGHKIIDADLDQLEREVKDFGNLHAMSAVFNEQPRPIGSSGKLHEPCLWSFYLQLI